MAYFRCMASGTGTGATITVSYESEVYGHTLTCTDGTHTYTKTAASTGSTVFTVPNGGTWTISVVMYGHTYSQQVIVVSEYTCTLALWSATVNISTTATELYSQTITVKKGGSTIGSTAFDSSGSATYIAPEEGTYTFECTYSGQTYSASVNVTEETTYSVVISMGLELSNWLTAGGLDPSDYADLSEVLADEEAVRRLMTIHDSVDYLATASAGDEMMETIIADDICAKWINLRDYALDTLYANSDIASEMDDAGKYFLGEWVCEGQVPVMTSNTAPYGEVIRSTIYSSYDSFKAFDGDKTTAWIANTGSNQYIGYKFLSPVAVTKFRIYCVNNGYYGSGQYTYKDAKFQASNDGTNWVDLYTWTNTEKLQDATFEVPKENVGNYIYYRVYIINNYGGGDTGGFSILQFYAYQPKGNVPIMTSNTAPYGEAIVSSNVSGSEAYKAFDNDLTTFAGTANAAGQQNTYIGYHFVNPVCVKRFKAYLYNGAGENGKIICQGSNDGSTWVDLTEEIDLGITSSDKVWVNSDVDNDDYYLYYRIFTSQSSTTAGRFWYGVLQFYGREMKVSVPAMTSNTQPWGEASASSSHGDWYAWKAFDSIIGSDWTAANFWIPSSGSDNNYIEYDFDKSILIKKVEVWFNAFSGGKSLSDDDMILQASNDGTTWTDLHSYDAVNVNQNLQGIKTDLDANETPYSMYRLFIKPVMFTNATSSIGITKLQFFGFDYSERDWDTEHPMRYLYDHGVELETITLSGTATKEPDDIKLSAASSDATATLDTTDYDLLRAVVGKYASGTNVLKAGSGSATFTAANMPYNQSLDVSNINGSNAVGVGQTSTGIFTAEEWWLE